jgi:membrane protease YdiL (CAAX protease family)
VATTVSTGPYPDLEMDLPCWDLCVEHEPSQRTAHSVNLFSRPIFTYYPLNASAAVKSLVGIVTFIPMSKIFEVLENSVCSKIKTCFKQEFSQDAVKIFSLSQINPVLAVAAGLYIAVIGPMIEEIIFRGDIQDSLNTYFEEKCPNRAAAKILSTSCSSLIFGAAHLSPLQNTASNIIIMLFTTAMGVTMSALKETTGDLWAPTAFHITNNTVAVYQLITS